METLEKQISSLLSTFWDERAIGPIDESSDTSSIESIVAPIDSFSAVHALTELDALLNLHLPYSVIKNGGYNTKSEFVTELTNQVLQYVKVAEHE